MFYHILSMVLKGPGGYRALTFGCSPHHRERIAEVSASTTSLLEGTVSI